MAGSIHLNLEKLSTAVNATIPMSFLFFFALGHYFSFYFHFFSVFFLMLTLLNFFYRHVQLEHTILRNFGVMAQARYVLESIGPELRQYLFSSDTEERPFNRVERSEVYQKSKNIDSSKAFGSLMSYDATEPKLRHSMYPVHKDDIQPFQLTIGQARGIKSAYALQGPIMVSAMSFGALGKNAVKALARGARKAGIPMNTGEGGYPKYHLEENCDLIFQIGTAKFGVRDENGRLDDQKLQQISQLDQVKMIEIKLSQGAKPGKGGILPKEKITREISQLRGVPMGSDVISPPYHHECSDAKSLVKFIHRVQEVSSLPVGIKLCFGQKLQVEEMLREMQRQNIIPDFISIDGAEGGTGAAPKSFLDDIGVPLFEALPAVHKLLKDLDLIEKTHLFASGKLINAGKQMMAMCYGAQSIYTARGFLLALGCIQALQCNQNTCPVGITTHIKKLQLGVDVETKSDRVAMYAKNLMKEHYDLLAALGQTNFNQLGPHLLFQSHDWRNKKEFA